MANVAAARPFAECDFDDKIRLHPMRVAAEPPGWTRSERGRIDFDLLQACAKHLPKCLRPTGAIADLAGKPQRSAFVNAHEHRSNTDARSVRIGESSDHEFLAFGALRLLPIRSASARLILCVSSLADDSFSAKLACFCKDLRAVVVEMFAVTQDGRGAIEQTAQLLLALAKGQAAKILAV